MPGRGQGPPQAGSTINSSTSIVRQLRVWFCRWPLRDRLAPPPSALHPPPPVNTHLINYVWDLQVRCRRRKLGSRSTLGPFLFQPGFDALWCCVCFCKPSPGKHFVHALVHAYVCGNHLERESEHILTTYKHMHSSRCGTTCYARTRSDKHTRSLIHMHGLCAKTRARLACAR